MLLCESRGASMDMWFELITRIPMIDLHCKDTDWMRSRGTIPRILICLIRIILCSTRHGCMLQQVLLHLERST
jgi:hypothetical protein